MAIFNTFADKEASFDMISAISFIPISSFEEIEISLYATVGKAGRKDSSVKAKRLVNNTASGCFINQQKSISVTRVMALS